MEKTLISIVVPVYNSERYLVRCLDSLVNQTYVNLEIICVNDGSTDGSLAVLQSYADTDSRIQIVSQPNGGLSAARNAGVAHATGDYIYFCDSDDYLSKNAIAALYDFAAKSDLDIVEGRIVYKTDCETEYSAVQESVSLISGNESVWNFYLSAYKKVNACSKLIKRTLFLDYDLAFTVGQISEDILWLYTKVLPHTKKMAFCFEATYYYVKNNTGTITQSHSLRHYQSYLAIFESLKTDEAFVSLVHAYKSSVLGDLLFEALKESYFLSSDAKQAFRTVYALMRQNHVCMSYLSLKRKCILLPIKRVPLFKYATFRFVFSFAR